MSPSARKVWIEIIRDSGHWDAVKESPSARKVWIEIDTNSIWKCPLPVTFRKEGVD